MQSESAGGGEDAVSEGVTGSHVLFCLRARTSVLLGWDRGAGCVRTPFLRTRWVMHEERATRQGQICTATTRKGHPCTQTAMAGGRLCASHAGRDGARSDKANAVGPGLYGESLSPREQVALVAARAAEGVDDEIAVTRLMIVRALEEQKARQEQDAPPEQPEHKVPPQAYTRLVEALCRQLRTRRQVRGESVESLMGALAVVLDEFGTELGLNAS